ncbi:hypothetical protein ACV3X1_00430 [Clostridium perfringens]|uniref:hypothetical protein n=1 Tax=Clostridium perfringens TaxID=1502 RepID=UPI0013E3181A|nr:hypothetical protein [Clostridium perfringens]ELC8455639.1 hypothetical protein [Clostridium perfringens]MDM0720322.1 hypothetical protein [Clostridium perfringens]MDM0723388.1 hypothetical protein [Clostridium perfringens]QPS27044.1 hypothetical protein I6G61_11470 [Clostridium perfringens]UBK42086.1 hypothetical protein KLF28_06215 [Clostridium perfringens]
MKKFVLIKTADNLPLWADRLCKINGDMRNLSSECGVKLYSIDIEFDKALKIIEDTYGEAYNVYINEDKEKNVSFIIIEDKK